MQQCLAIRSHVLGMQNPNSAAVLHALLSSPARIQQAAIQIWLESVHRGHVHPRLATILVDMAAVTRNAAPPVYALKQQWTPTTLYRLKHV